MSAQTVTQMHQSMGPKGSLHMPSSAACTQGYAAKWGCCAVLLGSGQAVSALSVVTAWHTWRHVVALQP